MVVWRLEKGKRYRLRFFISFCVTFLLAFVFEMCYVQKISARYIAFLFGHGSLDDLSLPSIFTALHFPDFSASAWFLIFRCQKQPSTLRNLRIFLQNRKENFFLFSFFTRFLQQNNEEQRIQRTCVRFDSWLLQELKKKKKKNGNKRVGNKRRKKKWLYQSSSRAMKKKHTI